VRVENILALSSWVVTWMQGIVPYLVYVLATLHTPTVTVPPVVVKDVPPVVSTPEFVATVAPSIVSNNFDFWFQSSQWPSYMYETVKRIVKCESSFQPDIVSPGGYVGLMQIAPWFHGYPPSDPVGQLNQGYEVYLKQGWNAWSCY
jgi:hypothetical protein